MELASCGELRSSHHHEGRAEGRDTCIRYRLYHQRGRHKTISSPSRWLRCIQYRELSSAGRNTEGRRAGMTRPATHVSDNYLRWQVRYCIVCLHSMYFVPGKGSKCAQENGMCPFNDVAGVACLGRPPARHSSLSPPSFNSAAVGEKGLPRTMVTKGLSKNQSNPTSHERSDWQGSSTRRRICGFITAHGP